MLRALRLSLLLALASACGDRPEADDGRGRVPDVPGRAIDESGRAALSPAESAAAVKAVEAHSRAVHDSIRRASGLPDAPPPPPAPDARPVPATHAECMAEAARAADPAEREVLERGCRHLPGAP